MTQHNAAVRILKNTVALISGRVFVMLFSFVFIIYAARLLGASGFGKYALARGFFELFLSLCSAALGDVIIREIAKKSKEASRYICSSIILSIVLAFSSSAILIAVVHLFPYSADTKTAIYFVCIALFPASISMIYQAAFIAFEKAQYVTYAILIENLLRTGISILALFMDYGLLSLFVILIFSRVAMLIFFVICFKQKILKLQWQFTWNFLKKMIHVWKVFWVENLLIDFSSNFDVIAISFFHNEIAVGLYSAASRVLNLATVISSSYTTAIYPHMSKMFEKSKDTFDRMSDTSLKYMLIIILPVVALAAIYAENIILLLYTSDYSGSIPIFRVLLWVLLLRVFNPYLSYLLFAQGKQKEALKVVAVSFLAYLIAGFSIIPIWAGIGAAWARLLNLFVAFCLYFFMVTKMSDRAKQLFSVFGRTVLSVSVLAIFVFILKDINLVAVALVSVFVYLTFLFLLRVWTVTEFTSFYNLVSSAFRGAQNTVKE